MLANPWLFSQTILFKAPQSLLVQSLTFKPVQIFGTVVTL